MEASSNIIARMNTWHSTAVSQARAAELEAKKAELEAREAANKQLYSKTLDSFTSNFEALSILDGQEGDHDSRPGNVRTNTKSLQKTAEGFVMTLLTYQPVPGLGAVFPSAGPSEGGKPVGSGLKTLETYTVDERSNTISYTKMQESPLSGAGVGRAYRRGEEKPLGDNPSVVEVLKLDLQRGTIADLTPAAVAEPPRRDSLPDRFHPDHRNNGIL